MSALSRSMTLTQFDNGYWYATELRDFARSIGIPDAGKLRKDELESAIKTFLKTGAVGKSARRNPRVRVQRDSARGLSLDLPVVVYTNDPDTKAFLEREARTMAPDMRRKSGARYRLNRWREAQLAAGRKITYRDLVEEYVRLNRTEQPFAQIPHGRYINFMSDFLAAERGATKEQAIEAWWHVKEADMPKTYAAWRASLGTQAGNDDR